MSDPNIARYAELLREGRPYAAWMLMLDDVEKAGGDPEASERLMDALAAAHWAVAAEPDPADEFPEAAPMKVTLVKPAPVKRQRHLRVVGDY
jgi:hypothetical protein